MEASTRGAIYLVSTHGHFNLDPVTGSVATKGLDDTGGQTVYVVELAKALGKKGYPTFLVTRWFSPLHPQLQMIGENAWILRLEGGEFEFIHKEKIYPVLEQIFENLLGFISAEWQQMFLRAGLNPPESVSPLLFHGHYWDGGMVARWASRTFRSRLFWTSHSLGALKRERLSVDPKADQMVLEAKYNFLDRIGWESFLISKTLKHGGMTVTSRTEEGDLKRLYTWEEGLSLQTSFIPPGVDTDKFRPLNPDEVDPPIPDGPPSDHPMILMGGRFAETKGLDLGLKAFRQVLVEFSEARIGIFGADPNALKDEEMRVATELHNYRKEQGIEDRVFFLQSKTHDELPSVYRQSSVFIHPSRHEPFGMVTLEALACGVPVVVSSHAGVAKEFEHGKHLMIAEPEDSAAFADAIRKLLRDPEMAHRIASDGREHLNGRFSWEVIADQHLQLWRSKGVAL